MTIDLGFAWIELPDELAVSIIDVPGHERFIKNMLAGVGGLDAALLIVAADEGPMPQTIEHLAILDLLGIDNGIVVVTKADLVDQDWIDLVVEETREALSGSTLADAPIVPVSAETGDGIDLLLDQLHDLLQRVEPHGRTGKPRLPVDRVFSVSGFGTVVTGTLLGSPLVIGQELEILPSRLKARVRGVQSHGEKVDIAHPGSRTAINLTGVDREAIQRGDVVTTPGWMRPTRMIDARLRLVSGAPQPLSQNDPVDVFVGASESPAFVTLLDTNSIAPGEEGWVQIRLDRELAIADGDQFIVRQASPSITIGGGRVLNAHPRRHRRFRPEVIVDLETRSSGTPQERVLQTLQEGPREVRAVAEATSFDQEALQDILRELVSEGQVVALGADNQDSLAPTRLLARADDVEARANEIAATLGRYHGQYPLRSGMPREEVRSRLGLPARVFDALVQHLEVSGVVHERGSMLALPEHEIRLDDAQEALADRYIAALDASPDAPPAAATFNVDAELLGALAAQGRLVRMADNVVYSSNVLERFREETLSLIDNRGQITLAEFRDHFGSSRKYAQAVLEYFDQQRVTRRVGDARVRGHG